MALLNKEYMQKLGQIRLHYGNIAEILKAIEEAKEYINELSGIVHNREPDIESIRRNGRRICYYGACEKYITDKRLRNKRMHEI